MVMAVLLQVYHCIVLYGYVYIAHNEGWRIFAYLMTGWEKDKKKKELSEKRKDEITEDYNFLSKEQNWPSESC